MASKILITDEVHPFFQEAMEAKGAVVHHHAAISRAEVLSIIGNYEILLINSRIKADRELIEKAPQLKAIARIGSGLEVIDLQAAAEKNIICLNAPEGNKDAVAEHALGMLLCLLNNIHVANAQVKQQQWIREANRGIELGGKTVAIIGFGNNGSAFAEKLQGFNVKILAYDKYKKDFGNQYVQEADMQQIFEEADIVSLHLPLTPETEYLVNNNFIKGFKKDIFLLNMSRGKIVNTGHLIKNISQKKVRGACLDVLENEKLETLTSEQQQWFQQLIQMPEVLLTPHIAGWTQESKLKIAQVLATKLTNIISSI